MFVKKAGCILVDKENRKIGIIYRKKQQDYTFPKGHLENNETFFECAIRETAEETKRDCKILSKKPLIIEKYNDSKNDNVKLYYYLALDKGPSNNLCEDTHDLIWTDFDKVEDTLSYESLKEIWNKIKVEVYKLIKQKPGQPRFFLFIFYFVFLRFYILYILLVHFQILFLYRILVLQQ